MQAAVLRVKLRRLDEWNQRRRDVAAAYLASLSDGPVALPVVPPWADPVWHLFVVRAHDRAGLQRHLATAGIETLIHYPLPPHHQGAYADLADRSFPISERMHREVLILPIGPHLSVGQVDRVVVAVLSFGA